MTLTEVSANARYKGKTKDKIRMDTGCINQVVSNWDETGHGVRCISCRTCRNSEMKDVYERVTWNENR